MTDNINVVIINMPSGINEAVTENADGSVTVFINDSLSQSGKVAAYQHAIVHITEQDFQKNNVQKIESYAHQ